MPSIRPAVLLVATGALLLTGCGSGDDTSPGGGAATSPAVSDTPADTPKTTAAASTYSDPMDIAKKISKAGVGCDKPKRTESLGTGKVICGGADNISVEFYPNPKAFKEVKKLLCGMDATTTIVADKGRLWMVTTLNKATTKRVHKAVGGKLVKVC